jgi:hypothetical protein
LGYHPVQRPRCVEEATNKFSAQKEIKKVLDLAYAGVLMSSDGESAPSIVWRSELQFLGNVIGIDEPRWATRFHIWENLSECQEARYVGFLNLRPEQVTRLVDEENRGTIADAFLAPPARMMYPPYHLTALGTYSRVYGIEPYGCIPFSKPYKIFGSLCAQASIFVALVICTRLGGHAIGTFEITCIANPGKDFFPVEGLTVEQIGAVFKDQSVKLNSFLEIFRNVEGPDQDLKFSGINRTILGYLEAGLPVILSVDYNMLYRPTTPKPASHCIVLIGYKRGTGLDPDCYMYNDSARGPFMERDSFSLLTAAIGTDKSVKLIVPVPFGVAHSLTKIPEVHQKFAHEVKEGSGFRYFLSSDRVLRQYSVGQSPEIRNTESIGSDQPVEEFIGPQLRLAQLKMPKYVWVKEFYESIKDTMMGYCSAFALFDATIDPEEGQDPFILFFDGEHLTLRDQMPLFVLKRRKIRVKRIPLVA